MSVPAEIGVVGLGLMGASLARAARAVRPDVRVVAVEPRADVRAQALADGVAQVATAAPDAALARAGLVFLCTPVAAIEALLAPVSALLADGAVLTDVGGAKERIVLLARERVRSAVAFVGAHPMFGGHGGYAGGAAAAEKWKGGAVAVITDAPPAAVDAVAAFHEALGARVVRCTAAEHDGAVAMVSHLPYLVASALATAAREAGPLARELAGPGLKDMTRLAQFPFDVQGEVARRNAHVPEAARRLQGHLARILAAIQDSPEAARNALEAARAAREELF
ncbi:prephenate dehydrogenase [Anaeromyxobacter oryzae]|uniref:Arogenate dehydrogenase n=1 Tax=Anaeromyxobacter oryzae TaxID=2918170 RepID=A0ABN6MW24_9BACT|nr:prephenate dehydrogenase [Anaeromyxobacter oryzae]BDG03733.1 arogenate dehydrogenase [Anaeromyxobacter oryzae]